MFDQLEMWKSKCLKLYCIRGDTYTSSQQKEEVELKHLLVSGTLWSLEKMGFIQECERMSGNVLEL